jgi:hypothetical protein
MLKNPKFMPKFTQIFIALFVLFMTLTVLQVQCYAQHRYFIVTEQNEKFGVVDNEGKVILPFIFYDCRKLSNDFFVVRDTNELCSEYIVDSTRRVLTEPVFCGIDSFANGEVYQFWNKVKLVYTSSGECTSPKEKQNQKGIFKLFLKDSVTKSIYRPTAKIPVEVEKLELIIISPNSYQYKIQKGSFSFMPRRGYSKNMINNYLLFEPHERDTVGLHPIHLKLTEILVLDTKANNETIVTGRWNYRFSDFYSK